MESFVFDDGTLSLSFMAWEECMTELATSLPDDHIMKTALMAVSGSDKSPLFLATVFGIQSLLRLVIERDHALDWDQRNDLGHTAMYVASGAGNLRIVQTLIAHGAQIDVQCGKYGSPLHAACFMGQTDVVSLLLENEASVTCGKRFRNALEAACQGNQEEVALVLLGQRPMIDSAAEYNEAVESAAQSGFIRVLEWLERSELARKFGSPDNDTAAKKYATKAIQGGQVGVLRRRLRGAEDPLQSLPEDAVAIAAAHAQDDVIRCLHDRGVSIETE
jgi:hypothetical protein